MAVWDVTGKGKLANDLEVKVEGEGLRFVVVVARFNSEITEGLLFGVLYGLRQYGVQPVDVDVVRVPGAFEIPLAAMTVAKAGKTDGVICVGSIIKGETPHWAHLSRAVTFGMLEAGLETGVPVISAVLTTKTEDQASNRSVTFEKNEDAFEFLAPVTSEPRLYTGKMTESNRGYDAALVAVEMACKYRSLNSEET